MNLKVIILLSIFFIELNFATKAQVTVDSTVFANDSIAFDSSATKKTKREKRSQRVSKTKSGDEKPEKLERLTWNQKSLGEKDSLLRKWSAYDMKKYREKYSYSKSEKKSMSKPQKNLIDKYKIRKAYKKPVKYRKKLLKRKNARLKKTLAFEKPQKMSDAQWDNTSSEDRLKYIQRRSRYQGQKEAIRKNKVVQKYDKKEDKITKKYALSDEEKLILNKGRGMHLRGTEQLIFKRAQSKQQKFSDEFIELRRKRQVEIQNLSTQKKIKERQKSMNKRDKQLSKNISKQEKNAKKNEKKKAKMRKKNRK